MTESIPAVPVDALGGDAVPDAGGSVGTAANRLLADREVQWFIVSRWAEFEGEARANLLRIVAIGTFYVIELLSYYGLHLGWLQFEATSDRRFHIIVTGLAAAWAMMALVTLFCLRGRIFPGALKYVTTTCDVVLLTMILTVGDGPRSAMVVGYFLVIALATLRFRLQLVWCATLGSLLGYLVVLGYAKWYAPAGRDLSVPRYTQLILLASLALEGLMLGQVIRRVRQLATDFARRIQRGT
jgi:hypothetical protein